MLNTLQNSIHEAQESLFLGLANALPRSRMSDKIRALVLKAAGVKISPSATVWSPLELRPIGGGCRLTIGDRTFINTGVRFACAPPATITVGNYVQIGPGCMFETANHPLEITEPKQLRPLIAESIVIEDNVWLGARVTVVSGVTIGKGSVVAAGAVVTANVPPYTLVGGIPARVIKSIPAGSQTPATIASTPGENKTMPVADDPTAS